MPTIVHILIYVVCTHPYHFRRNSCNSWVPGLISGKTYYYKPLIITIIYRQIILELFRLKKRKNITHVTRLSFLASVINFRLHILFKDVLIMKVYEILSEKRKPILVVFNFKFRLHKKLANGLERWCCTNKRCKSYLKRRDKNILKNDGKFDVSDHNHKPAPQQLRNDILLKDTEHTSNRPSMLRHSALENSSKLI